MASFDSNRLIKDTHILWKHHRLTRHLRYLFQLGGFSHWVHNPTCPRQSRCSKLSASPPHRERQRKVKKWPTASKSDPCSEGRAGNVLSLFCAESTRAELLMGAEEAGPESVKPKARKIYEILQNTLEPFRRWDRLHRCQT